MIPRSCWSKQRLFNSPSSPLNAVDDGTGGQSSDGRPIKDTPRLSVVRVKTVCALVACLFSNGCPSAICSPSHESTLRAMSARIASVVVDPVNRKRVRGIAHVGPKLHHIAPALAQLDPAPSVVMVSSVGRTIATGFNSTPDVVNSGAASRPIEAVNRLTCGKKFPLKTSATLAVSTCQIRARYQSEAATIAETIPHGGAVFRIRSTNSAHHKQAIEFLADQVNGDLRLTAHLSHFASARLRFALSENEAVQALERAADASAFPNCVSVDVCSDAPNGGEVSECLARNVFDERVGYGSILISDLHGFFMWIVSTGTPLLRIAGALFSTT